MALFLGSVKPSASPFRDFAMAAGALEGKLVVYLSGPQASLT